MVVRCRLEFEATVRQRLGSGPALICSTMVMRGGRRVRARPDKACNKSSVREFAILG